MESEGSIRRSLQTERARSALVEEEPRDLRFVAYAQHAAHGLAQQQVIGHVEDRQCRDDHSAGTAQSML
jgi:hypothetical protein